MALILTTSYADDDSPERIADSVIKVTVTGSATVNYTAVVEVPFVAEDIYDNYDGETDDYVADWIADNLEAGRLITGGTTGQPHVASFVIDSTDDEEIEDSSGFLLSREQQAELDELDRTDGQYE